MEVRNDQPLEGEIAQFQMSVDGDEPELVNIIANLPAGESVSFAFARSLASGPHAIRFSVGDAHTTVNVNVEAGDIIATLTPTSPETTSPVSVVTPPPTLNPVSEPRVTVTATTWTLVYSTPTNTLALTATATPIPTQTPVQPTNTPEPKSVLPSPTYTPESESLVSRFFKSARDLTEANDSSQPDIDIGELEMLAHSLINQERVKRDMNALRWEDEIAAIARDHSLDMGNNGYFSHVNRDGQNATDRGRREGYDCIKDYGSYYTFGLAENIHQGWLYSSTTYIDGVAFYNWSSQGEIAARAVNGWMESQGHRENILKDSYDRTGIGISITSEGKVFITQNFC